MENEYYTPDIEDIRVGYECEVESNSKWKPIIINAIDSEENSIGTDSGSYWLTAQNIKTPYLIKEQIEAEGWLPTVGKDYKVTLFRKDGYTLGYNWERKTLKIAEVSTGNTYYLGNCPSINEFRLITKLIKIKK
jgi:hypothetical protein